MLPPRPNRTYTIRPYTTPYRFYNPPSDDLKQAVGVACASLYNDVWTEYSTKHALALQKLVAEQGVLVTKLPDDVMVAMGNAAGEVIAELRENDDELVERIVERFLTYRNPLERSEDRRVRKECGRKWRSGWSQYHSKKKI